MRVLWTLPQAHQAFVFREIGGLCRHFERALVIREKAAALNKLGLVFWAQAKYIEAEGLHKRALAIREKALGASHPDVGQTLNNLALVYRSQGKYTEAEALLKRALAIREKALGANHSDVGQTLTNLANARSIPID